LCRSRVKAVLVRPDRHASQRNTKSVRHRFEACQRVQP
jgi:hypothetical protein